jgi:hypothetical protein
VVTQQRGEAGEGASVDPLESAVVARSWYGERSVECSREGVTVPRF